MKLFQQNEIFKAYAYAAGGGQALHLFDWPGASPGAPRCFKGAKQGGHLIDRNRERLITTAKSLGVRVIKLGRVKGLTNSTLTYVVDRYNRR